MWEHLISSIKLSRWPQAKSGDSRSCETSFIHKVAENIWTQTKCCSKSAVSAPSTHPTLCVCVCVCPRWCCSTSECDGNFQKLNDRANDEVSINVHTLPHSRCFRGHFYPLLLLELFFPTSPHSQCRHGLDIVHFVVTQSSIDRESERTRTNWRLPDSEEATLPGAFWRFCVGVFTWVGVRTKIWVWEIAKGEQSTNMCTVTTYVCVSFVGCIINSFCFSFKVGVGMNQLLKKVKSSHLLLDK